MRVEARAGGWLAFRGGINTASKIKHSEELCKGLVKRP